ncbi:glutamyl-tRNA(Gln) and/or aspartyl-tRNA(Asn) amidotransferase, C subunit [Burkholderia multivorans CGD1]|nr:glutamyl-tRNA(Gln) and/or aspartyl-tRNA(Asn) amidotransferase, C subunit [Burkholderia multivorans CGD1]
MPKQGRNGAGKGCRVWVERVMIPYNFAVFESKRAVFLPLRPRFLRVGSHPSTPAAAPLSRAAQPCFSGDRMALTLTDVKRIAHLARLEMADADAEHTLGQLNEFFGLVEQMQAVDTAGIAPLAHPIEQIQEVAQRLRDDAVTEVVNRDDNQRPAPAVQDGLYLVPKVIE